MRTFVAIEIPIDVQAGIDSSSRRLGDYLRACCLTRAVRWTPAAKLHLTLRFLGETSSSQKRAVMDGMSALVRTSRPLMLRVAQYGCFPNSRAPSVIWRGLKASCHSLIRFQSEIEQVAQRAGYEAESRPYAPHLTVGRVRRGLSRTEQRKLGDCLSGFLEQGDIPGETEILVRHSATGLRRLQRRTDTQCVEAGRRSIHRAGTISVGVKGRVEVVRQAVGERTERTRFVRISRKNAGFFSA